MPGDCVGPANCNDIEDEGDCWDCGCEWDFGMCFPDDVDCEGIGNEWDCLNCGCEWVEAPDIGDNVKINIADVFKSAAEMKINIGDVFKNVVEIKINIGDVWKTVWTA